MAAAVSPKLTAMLGLVVVAAGAFTYSNHGIEDDPFDSETFELPLAFVDVTEGGPVTTWTAPQATRNPFDSGGVAVDPDRVESTSIESQPDATINATDSSATSPQATPERTSTTLTLEQTIDRRVPPGAPPVTTVPAQPTATDTTASTPTTQDPGDLPGLDG